MAVLCSIVQGWTQEIGPFTLKVDGEPIDLTGFTVELKLRPNAGSKYSDTSGDTRLDGDQVTNKGQVYYKPDAEDFKWSKSPYAVHWKVTDGAGDVVFFPNVAADTIVVHKP